MNLQENTIFVCDYDVNVTHHVTYAPTKFEIVRTNVEELMNLQENTVLFYDLDLRIKATQDVA